MAKSVTFTKASGALIEGNVGIPFEPKSFDGDGPKRKIVLDLAPAAIDQIAEWESQIEPQRLSSCISEHGVRARINMDTVRTWQGARPVSLPPELRQTTANIALELKGIRNTKHQSGLCLHLTDIEPIEAKRQTPFQSLRDALKAAQDGTESDGSSTQVPSN